MFSYLEARIQEVASLTAKEWVEVKATLAAGENENFNCKKCLSKYKGRADGEEMLAKVRKVKGCEEVKSESIHKIGDVLRFSTCPGNFVRPQVSALLSAYAQFKQGVMPYAGGLMDQPAKIIELFDVIDSHVAERQASEQKRAGAMNRPSGVRRG